MRFVFRVDGNSMIGLGHLKRCLVLAKELGKYGDVQFISKAAPIKIPFSTIEMPAVGMKEDLILTREALAKLEPDVFIIDHHDMNREYLDNIRAFTKLLVVVDDLKKELCGDVLVNVNAFSLRMKYDCRGMVLLGPKYALIGKTARRKGIRRHADNILVSMGGADLLNLTPRIVSALRNARDVRVTVVIGPAFTNETEIRSAISDDRRFAAARTDNLPSLMLDHDMAICGGGTTLYELAATGTSAVIICQAENQLINARELDGNTLINLGMGNGVDENKIVSSAEALLGDYETRKRLSANGGKLVDCRGPERIRNAILHKIVSCKIRLIPAKMEDANAVWKWRNEKTTRLYSFNTAYIPFDAHKKWFAGALKDRNRKTFIVVYGGKKIGFVRIDFATNPEINIALDKHYRKLGLGPRLIRIACGLAGKNVIARIKEGNTASIKAFARAGFVASKENGIVEMRLPKNFTAP